MSRKLMTVVALAAFALPAATAHAQMGYGVSAGVSAPTGTLGNSVDAGFNVNGMLTFAAPLSPFGLRVEGSWNQFNFKSTPLIPSATYRVLSGTANVILTQPGIMGPYAIAGLGIYNTNSSCSGCASNSNSNIGINGGGGFRFGLGGFSAFVEARYHYVPGKNGNPKTTFVPITFGVTF